ncbi:Fic family protein [Campylobacter corcagiensis]|uniref:protein adenylyltransferase n=1 Tax=Campylobacter corcagiensis TaxID=1448857 RepID=A0A6M8MKJ1_9BACT|nr:Fic family protein [Campylobacter corcagiensis]QKF65544.1 protein-threonine AMPylation domain-containing protein [Campylobacter corcagiensis]QOQ86548.1 Fic family protein [Campylobacter corcagiensis]
MNYDFKSIEVGVGLNGVDDLKPSKNFYKIVKESTNYKEAENNLKQYYQTDKTVNSEEKECDIVAIRIANLINEKAFVFSPEALKQIHKKLFEGVFEGKLNLMVGEFRSYNIIKSEEILDGRSVTYGDYEELSSYLSYDFNEEKKKNYALMSLNEQVKNISDFISKIWQIHPFAEGNTRTTAVFAIKYLKKMGFELDNSLFRDSSKYFRNALVLSNFSDVKAKIGEDRSYLDSFFAKLMIDNKLELKEMKNPYKINIENNLKDIKSLSSKFNEILSDEETKTNTEKQSNIRKQK